MVLLLLAGCGGEADDVAASAPYQGEMVSIDDEVGCPFVEWEQAPFVPSGTFYGEYLYSASELEGGGVFFGSQAVYWTPQGGVTPVAPEEESWTVVGDWMVNLVDWSYRHLEPDGTTTNVGTLPIQSSIIGAVDPVRGRLYAVGGAEGRQVYSVDLATGTVAWSVPISVPPLLAPAADRGQVFSIVDEQFIVAFDAETGAMTQEELPQPRIFHWILAADGEWRLLMTRSNEVPGDVIEWWHPASKTAVPVAVADRIELCGNCLDASIGDAMWHTSTVHLVRDRLLYQITADGRCSFRGGSGSLLRGSRKQGGRVTEEGYWYDGSGVWRF